MLVNVEKLSNENIIVVTYKAPFRPVEDIVNAQKQIAVLLEEAEEKLYRIDDLSNAEMGWNEFIEGINVATKDEPGSMVDPRLHGVIVGEGAMIKLAVESMKQEQYGATQTPMFTSLEDALNHVRSQNKN